jgi:hypothetical protein
VASFRPGPGHFATLRTTTAVFHVAENSARDRPRHYGGSPGEGEVLKDTHGFTWAVVRRAPTLYSSLDTHLRAASKIFADNKLGAQLLCAMTIFRHADTTPVALVYHVPIESDLTRWMAVWDAPVLKY